MTDEEKLEKAIPVDWKEAGVNLIYSHQLEAYFSDPNELFDAIHEHNFDCNDEDVRAFPEWAFCTEPVYFKFNAEQMVEDAEVDLAFGLADPDDMKRADPEEVEKLQALLDEWCKRQGIQYYNQDETRKVDLREDLTQWIKENAPEVCTAK